jgi:hypothetical protein
VAGWDEHQRWIERIRNYRSRPIDVEMRRTFPGHVEFRSRLAPTLHDYSSPQFSARIEPGAKGELAYHLVMHRGYNEKQHNVTLEQGD